MSPHICARAPTGCCTKQVGAPSALGGTKHRSMFPRGASTGCLSSVLGCAHGGHHPSASTLLLASRAPCQVLKVPLEPQDQPSSFGLTQAGPQRAVRAGGELWQGWALCCTGPTALLSPPSSHTVHRDRAAARTAQSTLRNGHVHTPTPTTAQTSSILSLRHQHLLCSGSG